MHPKTMLFVNNNQRQVVVIHIALKQRMGADQHRHLTRGNPLEELSSGFPFGAPAEPTNLDAKWLQPL